MVQDDVRRRDPGQQVGHVRVGQEAVPDESIAEVDEQGDDDGEDGRFPLPQEGAEAMSQRPQEAVAACAGRQAAARSRPPCAQRYHSRLCSVLCVLALRADGLSAYLKRLT